MTTVRATGGDGAAVKAYDPRLVTIHAPVRTAHCTFKVYGLFADAGRQSEFPSTDTLQAEVEERSTERYAGDHGLGFAIRHFGRDGDYLLISEWYGGDMLRHRVYGSDVSGDALAPLVPGDLVACVWELEIMRFERDAWVQTVLATGLLTDATSKAYLDTQLSGWV